MTTKFKLTAGALALGLAAAAHAQGGPIKVGLMLPYTGTYAALGHMIEDGFKLYVQEQGGKLAGREIEYVKLDDESAPAKATDNVNKLIKRDQVDVIVGTVHSGVALAMAKAAKDSGTWLIVPNAGRAVSAAALPAANASVDPCGEDPAAPGWKSGTVTRPSGGALRRTSPKNNAVPL